FFARDWLDRGLNFVQSRESLSARAAELFDLSTLISPEPFRDLLRDTVQLSGILRSKKKLRIAATNWETGELRCFVNHDMRDEVGHLAIMASTSIPGVFPPIEIGGDPYVDGGILLNTPLKPAIEAGGETLHVFYLDPDVKNIPLRRLQNTLDTLDRMMTTSFAAKVNLDMKMAARINDEIKAGKEAENGIKQLTIHRYHPRDDKGG